MPKESRAHLRIDEKFSVSYHLLKMPHSVSSQAANISETGLRLPVLHKFSPGTHIELEITVQGLSRAVVAVAEVIWCRERKDIRFPYEAGMRFIKIDSSDCNKLRQYIQVIYEEKKRDDVGWIEK